MALVMMGNMSFAQGKKPAGKENVAERKVDKKQDATPSPKKKDGTPDMRYKASKEAAAAKPAGPLKKDGTPDKRYKANKK